MVSRRDERHGWTRILGVGLAALAIAACGGDADPTSSDEIANATYLSNATADGVVTLVGGSFDFPPGGEVERVELVDSARGDFDADDDLDAAVVLVEYRGREEFYRLHALMTDGGEARDIAVRLLGDRVIVENVRVLDDGTIEVDLMIRAPGDHAEAEPSTPITSKFAVTTRGLTPINPPNIRAGSPRTMSGGTTATLVSHQWILQSIEMGDWSQTMDGLTDRPTLSFVAELGSASAGTGRMSGYAGCNRIFSGYSNQDGGALRITAIGATRRTCPEPLGDIEERVIASLASAESFEITDDQLVISFNGGVMRFSAGSEIEPAETAADAMPRGDRTPPGTPEGADAGGRQT